VCVMTEADRGRRGQMCTKDANVCLSSSGLASKVSLRPVSPFAHLRKGLADPAAPARDHYDLVRARQLKGTGMQHIGHDDEHQDRARHGEERPGARQWEPRWEHAVQSNVAHVLVNTILLL
jgi:hypothetical protein